MENERCLIKRILKMSMYSLIMMIGLPFIMGFYSERNIFAKFNDITVELGDKLPEEITDYVTLIADKSNLTIESEVPLDEDGNTNMIGNYFYYLVYNDSSYKVSRLTNAKAVINVIDTINPIITVKNDKFDYGSKVNVDSIVTCSDLSGCELSMDADIDSNKSGEYKVNIEATDGANNKSYLTATITIKEKPKPVYRYNGSFKSIDNYNNSLNANLSEEEKANLRKEIANFAKQFIGNPYVYGGTSLTNGTDCSGFTMSVYANYGYRLPRISTDQAYVGKNISESELEPGDLVVYFADGHVAMYVGDGMIVHASTPRNGIIYNKMYSGYRIYRRIIY